MQGDVLAADEIDDFWSLGIPLEAIHVPTEELTRAIAEHRVQLAVATGSMGTAETYWRRAEKTDPLDRVQSSGVVVPRGQRAYETPHEQWADDRDVEGLLWKPFRRAQVNTLAGCLLGAPRMIVLAEYARVLAELERASANGAALLAEAPLIAALYVTAPADADRVNGWLGTQKKFRRLVRGVRARWVSDDVAAAFDAVIERAHAMRLALLRFAVRVARGRPAPPIAVAGMPLEIAQTYEAQLRTLLRACAGELDEAARAELARIATRELLDARPKRHPGPPALTPIERCKTCTKLEQRITLDYERSAARPSALDALDRIVAEWSGKHEAWDERSVLRCRTCGTFYDVLRSKDEGHSFMDPTWDTEMITRLSLHAATEVLGTFGGSAAAEARAGHARRIARVIEGLAEMLADGTAPSWHVQKYACECLTQAGLLNDDPALLDRLLAHDDPVVRVQIALEVVELAKGFQPFVGQRALRRALEQAARSWLRGRSPTAVLDAVLDEPARPAFGRSNHDDRFVPTNTYQLATKALGLAADLAPIGDATFARVLALLGSDDEGLRFEAVWALIWIQKAAPSRVPAIRARLAELPAERRASPPMSMLERP